MDRPGGASRGKGRNGGDRAARPVFNRTKAAFARRLGPGSLLAEDHHSALGGRTDERLARLGRKPVLGRRRKGVHRTVRAGAGDHHAGEGQFDPEHAVRVELGPPRIIRQVVNQNARAAPQVFREDALMLE